MNEFGTVLITGGTGQDARIMLDKLSSRQTKVVCTQNTVFSSDFISQELDRGIIYENLDVRDTLRFMEVIKKHEPRVIFNFAGKSSVRDSHKFQADYMEINAFSVERILSSLHRSGYLKHCRFYQASSSEIFDPYEKEARNENSTTKPVNPYGKSKLYSHKLIQFYREQFGYFVSSGITFNHESEYRSENFVFGKVAWGLAKIQRSHQKTLNIGNLTSRRDWGYAPDYIEAMLLMMSAELPEDFVIATGALHSVYDVIETAYNICDISVPLSEILIFEERPAKFKDYTDLFGDPSQIRLRLGWEPKHDFYQTIEKIQKAALARI